MATTDKKQSKAQVIADLQRKIRELEAMQVHRHHFAMAYLDKVSTDRLQGSGIILSLDFLGGKEAISPLCISNGLSPETIAALKADIKRSFAYATELKP